MDSPRDPFPVKQQYFTCDCDRSLSYVFFSLLSFCCTTYSVSTTSGGEWAAFESMKRADTDSRVVIQLPLLVIDCLHSCETTGSLLFFWGGRGGGYGSSNISDTSAAENIMILAQNLGSIFDLECERITAGILSTSAPWWPKINLWAHALGVSCTFLTVTRTKMSNLFFFCLLFWFARVVLENVQIFMLGRSLHPR